MNNLFFKGIIATAATLSLCLNISAFAAEIPTEENTASAPVYNGANFIRDQQQSLVSKIYGNTMVFETSANLPDFNYLNVEYEKLQQDMVKNGFGNVNDLKVPDGQNGYSKSIQDIFKSDFGNINSKKLQKMQIPKGFSMAKVTSKAKSMRQQSLGDFKNSPEFKKTMNYINMSNVFDTASNLNDEFEKRGSMSSIIQEYKDNADPAVKGSNGNKIICDNANRYIEYEKLYKQSSKDLRAHNFKKMQESFKNETVADYN